MVVRILRVAAGLLILSVLIYFGRIDLTVLASALGHPALLALAGVLMLAAVPLAAFRWWLLTTALGFAMSYAWSLRTTFTGQFFNAFLPGAVSGDVVRLMLARRAAGRGLSQLLSSLLLDRLIGLAALVLLGVCMWPMLPEHFHQAVYLAPLAVGCALVAAGFVASVRWGNPIADLIGRLPAPLGPRLAGGVHGVLAALRAYANRWPTLVWTFGISAIQCTLIFAGLASLGAAMGLTALSPAGYVVAGAWASIVNSVPLTPGGLGIGEAAFAQIAAVLESFPSGASYANAFLAMRILSLLVSALGLLPYLAQRRELPGELPVEVGDAKLESPHVEGRVA